MTTQTLNAVAIDVIGQYGLATKNLLQAYRVGTERAVLKLNDGYSNVVKSSSVPMVDDSIRSSLVAAHQQFLAFIVDGVARATEQADVAIDRTIESTTTGLQKLGGFGDKVKSVVGAPAIDTITKLNMPAAQVSLSIAGAVVEGSKRLVERVGGAVVVTEEAAPAKAAKRAAK